MGIVEQLEQKLGADWGHLRTAREGSAVMRAKVEAAVRELDSDDTSIVISGSLARDEFTSGSDLDWMLLVDGQSNPRHHDLYLKAKQTIGALVREKPGTEKIFDSMVFGHNLIHAIGGEEDTNLNLTRRNLLLLESCAVARQDAYERVLRGILERFLLEDRGFWREGSAFRVPRFLQNDFARYWRTIAVDFAYKLRRRASEGWAIRNIKLRMSRKLIYASGLLTCYHFHLSPFDAKFRSSIGHGEVEQEVVVTHLGDVLRWTPLETLAHTLLDYPHLRTTAKKLFDSYNLFIGLLEDGDKRTRLNELPEEDAETDAVYREARGLSHNFRDSLIELFFDGESGLRTLTENYGVF